ncbi:MAG: HAD family hydrolase [Gemmatimonadota bacterium]|nr:HAD family hydrolase [Gemmatimonadota bacterium]
MNALPSAVFLDRDGTIIKDVSYLSRPEQVELLDGAAEAIARINAALVPAVIVTNQSGIGRGYFSVADYELTEQRLSALLAERGARVDTTYYCPHAPEENCRCRKPGTLLFERAADDLHIDLRNALFIGDRFRDIEPAMSFGAQGVLVPIPTTPGDEIARAVESARVADSLSVALDWYLCTN